MSLGTGTTSSAAVLAWGENVSAAPPPEPIKATRKPTRCLGRVGRRRCKCMSNDLWCHRHKAQEVAYFLRLSKPWSPTKVLEYLADRAVLDGEMEDATFDAAARTLTVKDWCGATFVLTLTKHVKARPFKERLADKLR